MCCTEIGKRLTLTVKWDIGNSNRRRGLYIASPDTCTPHSTNTSEGECAAPTPRVEEGIETGKLEGLLGELKVNPFPQFRSHIHLGGRAYAHDVLEGLRR